MSTKNHPHSVATAQVIAYGHQAHDRQNQAAFVHQNATEHHANKADRDYYDDGLVHGHFWAMSSTIR